MPEFDLIDQDGVTRVRGTATGAMTNPVTAGALNTVAFVSTTGRQVDVNNDVTLVVPVTYDASAADAKLKVELSPDGSTYSTLATVTIPFATQPVNGLIEPLILRVPAGWYVKLTTTHATLATATYY